MKKDLYHNWGFSYVFYRCFRKLRSLYKKLICKVNFYKRLYISPPVIIFQMGKVGSMSLKDSLEQLWPGLIVHTHYFERERKDIEAICDYYINNNKKIYVISPVREPIARNISAFFQNFKRDTGVEYRESTFSIEELITIFLDSYDHDIPLFWFDKYMKPNLGIDVYRYVFPQHGVRVIETNNVKLLIMRCELPDKTKEVAIRKFLSLPDFLITRKNVGAEKEYSATYSLFKETFVPPDWYIDRIYNSKYFNHFYAREKRKALIESWTKNG